MGFGYTRSTDARSSASGYKVLKAAAWGFGGGIFGGFLASLFAFARINNDPTLHAIAVQDPVAIANTYIVYTTFVMAAIAALMTLAGFIFAQHFATDRETHIANAFEALIGLMREDGEKAVAAAKQLMIHADVIALIDKTIGDRVDFELQSRTHNANTEAASAKSKADALAALNNQLKRQPNG